jgi:hypothetical protein
VHTSYLIVSGAKMSQQIGDTFPHMTNFSIAANTGNTSAVLGSVPTTHTQSGVVSSPSQHQQHGLRTQALLSMRGWLLKRKKGIFDPRNKPTSGISLILGDFNKRYFWIDSSIRLIYYSESEDRSKRVSFIPFNKLVSVVAVTEPMAINSARPGWVYGVELRTTDRVYELWARTPSEAKQWLEVLEKAASIGRLVSSTQYPSMITSAVPSTPAANGGTTTFNLAASLSSYVNDSNMMGSLSRRGSNSSQGNGVHSVSNGSETATTVPVVAGAASQLKQSNMDDAATVVLGAKENLDRTTNAVDIVRSPQGALKGRPSSALPSKWDEWDR